MESLLPFEKNSRPTAPGGYLYLVAKAGEEQLYGSAGSRTANPEAQIDRNTSFRLASLSKQYTAAAVLQAIAAQKLKWEDPLNRYWPELPAAVGRVTVAQLLNHSSGIIDYETLLPPSATEQVTDRDILSMIQARGKVYFTPGTRFRYSNTGYCLLAQLLEVCYNRPFPQLMQTLLFERGQITASVYQSNQPIAGRAYGFRKTDTETLAADQSATSATQGDGGLYTSLSAYQRWIRLLFSGKLVKGYSRLLFGRQPAAVQRGISYNLGWFIGRQQDGSPCVFHSGESTGFRNMVHYCPKKKVLCVVFSNTEGWQQALSDRFEALLHFAKCRPQLKEPLLQWMSRIYANT